MEKNNKKKTWLLITLMTFLLISTIGITLAFFNYTRTGSLNTIRVGRIYFDAVQGTSMNLTNAFPITSSELETDTNNHGTLTFTITGDTDYDEGIEYLLTLDDVNNTINGKSVPIALDISVTGSGLGTEEEGDYYANRENYETSKYKIEYDDNLEDGNHLLVGYISTNTTKGTIEGINGTLTIKAYLDKNKIAISDTYDGTASDNNGTTSNWVDGRVVLTTSEWNSLQSNGVSFKVKVEANEGIWVEKPLILTPASCFEVGAAIPQYIKNPNMDINACVSKFTELWGAEEEGNTVNVGETYEAFCNGTGTNWGNTLQQMIDDCNGSSVCNLNLTELENAGITINTGTYITSITNYDESCGSDVVIPRTINTITDATISPNMDVNTCINKFTELGETVNSANGETLEAFCDGTGTMWGRTFQSSLDKKRFGLSELTELENAGIIITNRGLASVGKIDNNAFYNKQLISVIIPDSVTMIDYNAFANNQITNLTIPNSVISISESAFENNNITTLSIDMNNIPENFSNIYGIENLTKLDLGNHVQTIGASAFSGNQLTSVIIGTSVTNIGKSAFYTASVYNSNPNLSSIINKTGRAFDWKNVLGDEQGDASTTFVTGTYSYGTGTVSITSE